jgi:hypothetical protein
LEILMSDFTNYRNNPDSLGRKLRVLGTLPTAIPNRAKIVWTKADATLTITDADGNNSVSGVDVDVKAGVPLPFVPERIASATPATVIYYAL